MAKLSYEILKNGIEEIQQYAASSAGNIQKFPDQGLGCHHLNTIAIKASSLLTLFNKDTENDRIKRENFFANQLPLLSATRVNTDEAKALSNVGYSGETKPKT